LRELCQVKTAGLQLENNSRVECGGQSELQATSKH